MVAHFYIKIDYSQTRINVDDVLFISSDRGKIHINLVDGTTLSKLMPLTRFAEFYNEHFTRVHRSFAINGEKIFRISSTEIILKPGSVKIPIGKSFLNNVKLLQSNNLN